MFRVNAPAQKVMDITGFRKALPGFFLLVRQVRADPKKVQNSYIV
jgi:hypothetical protein